MNGPTPDNSRIRRYRGLLLLTAISLAVTSVALGQQTRSTAARRAGRPAGLRIVQLPEADTSGGIGIASGLTRLRQVELPSNERPSYTAIGQLAWAAQGAAVSQMGTAAIPDNLLPIRVYFLLPDGVFLYSPTNHALEQVNTTDVRADVATTIHNQPNGPMGGCQIVLVNASRRTGTASRNAMLFQAGQMAQNIQLQAVSLELGFIGTAEITSAPIRRACRLTRDYEPLCVIMLGPPMSKSAQVAIERPNQTGTVRVVMIAPAIGFRDEELIETKRLLEAAAIQVLVASTRTGAITGSFGNSVAVDLTIPQVNAGDFSAVIFVGGEGTYTLVNNPVVLNLARNALSLNRLVAASGTAPSILASAGLVTGVQVTSYISEQNLLVISGGLYTGLPVQRDRLIITSTGPLATSLFAEAIIDALGGN